MWCHVYKKINTLEKIINSTTRNMKGTKIAKRQYMEIRKELDKLKSSGKLPPKEYEKLENKFLEVSGQLVFEALKGE